MAVKKSYTGQDLQAMFGFKNRKTPFNWEKVAGFPKHRVIGSRAYWDADAVDKWHKEKFAKSEPEGAK